MTAARPATLPSLLQRDGLSFLALVLVSFAIGLLVNAVRSTPLSLIPLTADQRLVRAVGGDPSVEGGPPQILDLDQVVERIDEGKTILVDAREPEFFELGRIAGAVNLPRGAFAENYAAFSDRVPKSEPLIIYCSEASCVDSSTVAKALQRLGYADVSVFPGGWMEWEAAGLPREP